MWLYLLHFSFIRRYTVLYFDYFQSFNLLGPNIQAGKSLFSFSNFRISCQEPRDFWKHSCAVKYHQQIAVVLLKINFKPSVSSCNNIFTWDEVLFSAKLRSIILKKDTARRKSSYHHPSIRCAVTCEFYKLFLVVSFFVSTCLSSSAAPSWQQQQHQTYNILYPPIRIHNDGLWKATC